MKTNLLIAIVLFGFLVLGVQTLTSHNTKLKKQEIELQSKDTKLNQLKLEYKQLDLRQKQMLEDTTTSQQQVEELKKQRDELDKRNQELQKQVKAKQERTAQKPSVVAKVLAPKKVQASASGGSCATWIAQAGISDVANAMWLINKESGCNPNAVNRSSGACGVAQELPCGKSGCGMGNGACQVAWMSKYVQQRYGSWAKAVSFHKANNWY